MGDSRDWMYRRKIDGYFNPAFISGLDNFIEYARSQHQNMSGDQIRCPCKRCDNAKFHDPAKVKHHIEKLGFTKDYTIWIFHGEDEVDEEYASMDEHRGTNESGSNSMNGTSSLALSLLSTGSSSSCATSQFHASQELQTQLTSLQEQLQEERRLKEEQAKRIEEQAKRIEEQAKQLAAIQQMLLRANFPQPPPNSSS